MAQTRRSKAYIWLAVLATIVVGGYFIAQVEVKISFTEEQAQAALDEQLEKLQAEHPEIVVDDVTINFQDNFMTLEVAGAYTTPAEPYGARVIDVALTASGDPDYRGGSIYFNPKDFTLESFTLDGEEPAEVMKRVIAALAVEIVPDARDSVLENERVQGFLETLGVSVDTTVNDEAISGAALIAEGLVEEYRAEGTALLEASVIFVLERAPLYTLGFSWKERVAMAALEDIGIEDGVFTATLTGMQLLVTLLIGGLALLISVGVVIMMLRGSGTATAVVIGSGLMGD